MIRVASFNLRNGLAWDGWNSWPFRRGATTAAVRALDADLIGLQEAYGFQARGLARRLDGYGLTGDGRSARRRGERCCVLHRTANLDLVTSETRWYGEHPDRPGTRLPGASFPRVATIADLAFAGGGPHFTFVDTHLDEHREENRLAAAEQLVDWVGGGPTIIVGDLNAGPTSPTVQRLEGAGFGLALPPGAGGTNHDFTGRTDGRRIDHILLSRHWQVRTARVVIDAPGGRLPSDHWPIVADVELVV